MFSLPRNIFFWIFIILASVSYILSMVFGYIYGNLPSKILLMICSVWLGFIMILLFILLLYDGLRFFIEFEPLRTGTIILSLVSILTLYGAFNAQNIRIRRVAVPSGNPGKPQELKIAHLSDLHIGPVHGTGFLKRIVTKVNSLEPDVVLLTGDLFDGASVYTEESIAPLNNFNAPVFMTIGNHEIYAGLDWALELLKKTKITVLRNEVVKFKGIQIIGIDYGWGRGYVDSVLQRMSYDRKKYSILMSHMPSGLEDANKNGINLILSGHTHGGQFIPIVIVAQFLWKYNRGLFNHKNTHLYTSTGIGTWGPPVRLGTRSEVALITI
jgi:predicted MPP superfamily phosphohydrolase